MKMYKVLNYSMQLDFMEYVDENDKYSDISYIKQ